MPAVKNVGEPCAGEPHARFEVAAGGNQDQLGQHVPRSPGASRRPYKKSSTSRRDGDLRRGPASSERIYGHPRREVLDQVNEFFDLVNQFLSRGAKPALTGNSSSGGNSLPDAGAPADPHFPTAGWRTPADAPPRPRNGVRAGPQPTEMDRSRAPTFSEAHGERRGAARRAGDSTAGWRGRGGWGRVAVRRAVLGRVYRRWHAWPAAGTPTVAGLPSTPRAGPLIRARLAPVSSAPPRRAISTARWCSRRARTNGNPRTISPLSPWPVP